MIDELQEQKIRVGTSVELSLGLLDENDLIALRNRAMLESAGARCVNLMSSPGSGKTTLLEQTLAFFQRDASSCGPDKDGWNSEHPSPNAQRPTPHPQHRTPNTQHPTPIAVIEGDMTTELDADRLRACGASVVAITTGRSCHLEADQIASGLQQLETDGGLDRFQLIVIENVGNLICPAAYDLGEHTRVVLVASTEGEDKPLKYPIMFHGADCVVITKLDLVPYLKLNVNKLIANIREVNPQAVILAVSAESGEGMESWLEWLRSQAETPISAGLGE